MPYPPVIAMLAPAIALLLTGDAGVPGGDAPSAGRSGPVLPVFPALGISRAKSPEPYQLREAQDGSGDLLYDAPGFSARVARDGGVRFKDRGISFLGALGPLLPKAGPRNVPSLQETIRGLARNKRIPRVDEGAQTDDSFLVIPNMSRFRPDTRERCRECATPLMLMPLNIAGRFDLTDELMRFHKQDPYRYEKARFLAETHKLRIEKAVQSHAVDILRALAELPGLLDRIACDPGLTRRERREVIQGLRDELEDESPEARTAAQQIDRFLTSRFASPVVNDGCARSPDQP